MYEIIYVRVSKGHSPSLHVVEWFLKKLEKLLCHSPKYIREIPTF